MLTTFRDAQIVSSVEKENKVDPPLSHANDGDVGLDPAARPVVAVEVGNPRSEVAHRHLLANSLALLRGLRQKAKWNQRTTKKQNY